MELRRRPGESKLAYHKRLLHGKLVDKTLSDYDYEELSDLIYGQHYSSTETRKMAYGSLKTLEILDSDRREGVGDQSLLTEIDNKLIELQKQTQITRDQSREYRKMMNSDGRWEHLRDELLEAAKRLPETVGEVFTDGMRWISDGDNEAVLILSDWHYGMTTDNAFNTYNTDVCKERVQTVIENAKKRISLHNCGKVHVVLLGDFCHGICHTGVRVASEELAVDQLLQVSEIIMQSILELYTCVPNIEIHCTYGNHMRAIPNKADNIHRDNWERVIPEWLTQRIGAECWRRQEQLNITVAPDTGTEFLLIDACGHSIVAAHGDLDTPRQSINVLPQLLKQKYGVDIEYILLGDKHHRESFEALNVTSRICGSLCGTDEYANTKRLYSQPSQLLLITSPDEGVDAEYSLKC